MEESSSISTANTHQEGEKQNASTEHFRGIRSFVNREGKFNSRLQKVWESNSDQFVISKVGLAVEFLRTLNCPIILEVGSGQGNQLVHGAKNNPDAILVGVEVYKTGVAHTLLLARNESVENFKVLMLDAVQLLEALAKTDVKVEEVWTFFPDPWPKKKHHKRRLINPQTFYLVKQVLKPNGAWRIATDWQNYAEHISAVLECKNTERFAGRLLTNFENKGIAAGREIFDFAWRLDRQQK
ncbi:tRNA (guanine-N(7)-)-methyltransferase [Actinomycetota bacterium]|nr:tRNA (guanine-N(7)-)-methyltransferase [Actinomycetota bacterium]